LAGLHTQHQFHSYPVTVGHVARHSLAYLVQLSGQYQLVFVVHIVEVGPGAQPSVPVGISQLIVEQFFRLWILVRVAVGIVVPCRFLLGDGERCVNPVVGVYVPVQPGFRVEKVEVIVYRQFLQGIRVVVKLIVVAVYLIVDVAVLQVGVRIEPRHQVIVGFQIEVAVRLLRFIPVIFVVGEQFADVVFHPDHPSKVPSVIMVQRTSQ